MGLNQGGWGESEKRLVGSLAGPRDAGDEEVCLEKRVFYRVISGLHASISVHICDDFLDQSTGLWVSRLPPFSLLSLRAFARTLADHLVDHIWC